MALSIHCPHCHQKTALSFGYNKHRQVCVWTDKYSREWWIGVCNGCGEPCLVCENGFPVYPHPRPTPTDALIPEELRHDLDEAKLCFSVQCFRACAVMARRCVQQACLSKGCKQTNLVSQIAELTLAGHITKDIEEWATVVRWIGNDAAHPGGQSVSEEDAEDALKLAEQFLHVLFVTPALAKARRTQRGK
jgi:ferredoxin